MGAIFFKFKNLFIDEQLPETEDIQLVDIFQNNRNNYIVVIEPKDSNTAQLIGDLIQNENTIVLLNLSSLDEKQATRLLDFISGIIYVYQNKIEKIADNIYIIANKSFFIKKVQDDEINNYTD